LYKRLIECYDISPELREAISNKKSVEELEAIMNTVKPQT